jgi:hypothetical protein
MANLNFHFGKLLGYKPLAAPVPGDLQHVLTVSWTQHSSDDDLSNNYYGPPAPDGWEIVQASVKFVTEWSQGVEGSDWGQNIISYNPVGFHVWSQHHGLGTSGKVNFHFEYDLRKL